MWENLWNSVLSQASALGILIALAYFFRSAILRFIDERISLASKRELQSRQHDFEERLDGVRRDFASIQSTQEKFLTAFLETSSERAKAVSKREIEAAEAIWASVDKLNRLLLPAMTADMMKFDAIEKLGGAERAKFGEFAGLLSNEMTPEFAEKVNCQWTRLYVNETAWAFYHAYSMILLAGGVRMKAMEAGIPVSSVIDDSALKKAILEALPHQKPVLEEYPNIRSTMFLDILRAALLKELRRSIHGEQSTEREAERARAILAALPNDVSVPGGGKASST